MEDADAHLLNLNVTAGTEPDSLTTVMLRVNHSRGESVARSLQRYGYETVEMTGDPGCFTPKWRSVSTRFCTTLKSKATSQINMRIAVFGNRYRKPTLRNFRPSLTLMSRHNVWVRWKSRFTITYAQC